MSRIRVGIVGNPTDIHLQRRLSKIDKTKYQVTILSQEYFKEKQWNEIPLFSIDIKKYKNLKYFRFFIDYYKFIAKEDYDIVYCFGTLSSLSWISGIAAKNILVLTTIGSDVFLEEQLDISFWVRKNVLNLARAADRVTVLSKAMKKRLQHDSGIPTKRILDDYLELEDLWYTTKAKDASTEEVFPRILSPRMLAPLYQQISVIKAVSLLKREYPDILLLQTTFGADKKYMESCKRLVQELELEKNVKFFEPIKDTLEMILMYDASDLIIMLPKSDGMPASMQEGWARNKPILVSNIHNYDEENNGKFFLKTDIDPFSIKEAAIQIFQDRSLRDLLKREGRRSIEKKRDFYNPLAIFDAITPSKKRNRFSVMRGQLYFLMFLLEPFYLRLRNKYRHGN